MAVNTPILSGAKAADLTLNGATTGTVVAGPTLLTPDVEVGTLSARLAVTAATATLTLAALWEVSINGTTWEQARGLSNAAPVVLTTGTSAALVRHVDAPSAAYGHRFARCSILIGGTTAGASDLANVSYDYRRDLGA